jgi:serine/threonine protein kinase
MKHINEPPPPIEGISVDLQAIIDRALAKDPDMRYQTAGEMAKEFLSVFNGQDASPDTKYFAEVARKAAEISMAKIQIQQPSRFPWKRIALEMVIALILAFIIFGFFCQCKFFP